MPVFDNPHYQNHEQVLFSQDSKTGFKAIIAIHDTRRGPALGGCRMYPYGSEEAALADVLQLSQGMTVKAAMADLPYGGGKSVIIGNPGTDKTRELLLSMGEFIHSMGGRYIAAEDSGTCVDDIKVIAERTPFVSGMRQRKNIRGNYVSGDPSPSTAYGVFIGIMAAVKFRFGHHDLKGLKVAIQGTGNVGYILAQLLAAAGAELWVSDINNRELQRAVLDLGATAVSPDEIFAQDVDVFAPCALGNIINKETLRLLKADIIAGSANNQLANSSIGEKLKDRGILYAPDFIINAGGLIDVAYQLDAFQSNDVSERIEIIDKNLQQIFQRSADSELSTADIAYQMAEERLAQSAFSPKASAGFGSQD